MLLSFIGIDSVFQNFAKVGRVDYDNLSFPCGEVAVIFDGTFLCLTIKQKPVYDCMLTVI